MVNEVSEEKDKVLANHSIDTASNKSNIASYFFLSGYSCVKSDCKLIILLPGVADERSICQILRYVLADAMLLMARL